MNNINIYEEHDINTLLLNIDIDTAVIIAQDLLPYVNYINTYEYFYEEYMSIIGLCRKLSVLYSSRDKSKQHYYENLKDVYILKQDLSL